VFIAMSSICWDYFLSHWVMFDILFIYLLVLLVSGRYR
jgi:hypothetical protein